MSVDWLYRALHRSGPFIEDPEYCIFRMDSDLHPQIISSCRDLIKTYINDPVREENGSEYISSLLNLAVLLKMTDVAYTLYRLVENDPVVPVRQQKSVLITILDLKVPMSAHFWKEIARNSPVELAMFSVTGLLRLGAYRRVLEIIPPLLEDEVLRDSLGFVLGQWSRNGEV